MEYYRSEEITSLVVGNPAAEKNKYNYRIPGIAVSKKGTVLVYWECRDYAKNRKDSTGKNGDECNMDLTVRRSTDGGKSFGEPIYIAYGEEFYQNGYGETLDNPVMIVGDDNRLHFLFCCDVGRNGLFYTYSDDDGLTWTKPRDITQGLRGGIAWDMLALGPGHGICLQHGEYAGRLIASAWTWCKKDAYPNGNGSTFCIGSRNTTVYSDDNGETWHIGEYASKNRDETSIVELSDGSVMINSRHYTLPYTDSDLVPYPEEEARRVVTVSPNGVDNWSETVFDPVLIDPACAGNICAVEVEGLPRAILFVNCGHTSKRWNLTVRCSFDDGKTWVKSVKLHPQGWYSDIAVDNRTGKVYVLHENPHVTEWFLMCQELFTFSFYDLFAKEYLEKGEQE
ncbi:MAG: exo-alpha-sialidase [Clostridia bacterium]|nr:exo-alpha-sialidase [Clostridia bacterium]